MTGKRHTDDGIHEQGGTSKALKRRGILAAAGAVVAGIVAKQASEPVEAISGGGDQGALILGSNPWYKVTAGPNAPNESYVPTVLQATPNFSNSIGANGTEAVVFKVDASTGGFGPIVGVKGVGGGNGASGVVGTAAGSSGYGVSGTGSSAGVIGTSGFGDGVYGTTTSSNTFAQGGVSGYASNTQGVLGKSENRNGVYGSTTSADAAYAGVAGNGFSTYGVMGTSNSSSGIFGITYGTGVVAGLYGTSNSAYGIIGNTVAAGYSGLTGVTSTPGVAALGATSTVANAYAAFFTGTTVVNGNFVATGGTKSAAVKDATGQHRLVYCVESPESWFEDFGKAKLVNGKAEVTLDKTFSEIVHTDEYHVFLTTEGDFHAHVGKKTASGFTVQQTTGTGSAGASGTLSYRVVAKRKDIVGERLAKWEMPKINHPDPDKLPKPELPRKP